MVMTKHELNNRISLIATDRDRLKADLKAKLKIQKMQRESLLATNMDIRGLRQILRSYRKEAIDLKKNALAQIAEERTLKKIVRQDYLARRAELVEQRRAERIRKLEARLEAERLKALSPKSRKRANRKASAVTVVEVTA